MTPRKIIITKYVVEFYGANGVWESTAKMTIGKKAHRKVTIKNDEDLINTAIELFKLSPRKWSKGDCGVVVKFNDSGVYLIEDDVK